MIVVSYGYDYTDCVTDCDRYMGGNQYTYEYQDAYNHKYSD